MSLIALVLTIWVLPLLLTRYPSTGLTAADRLKAENDARTPVVAALALVGAAALTARYTWRATKSTLQAQELDREGQITDRFTKAIDQLGSDKIDVRIGGIYALERIARDSARDHPVVMEVLTAFIRNHSHEPGNDVPTTTTRSDVQAAGTVICRRNASHDHERIDLASANLAHMTLTGADLCDADFAQADLTGANLQGADLTGADLFETILTGAMLMLSNLMDANLSGANLSGANLISANLSRANLAEAKLTGADMTQADLTNAYLTGAILTGVKLVGALYPSDTPLPPGWMRDSDSGRLQRARPLGAE